MEILINFFDETLIKKNSLISILKPFYDNWKIKRAVLNSICFLINISVLIFATNIMMAFHLEWFWLFCIIIYASVYWILSSLLIDRLIGDEIDNNAHKHIND